MKIIFYLVLLIFLFFIQIIFLPYLSILRYLNLVFCCLLIYRLISKEYFLFYVILAGLLSEMYSMFPKGFYLILFLINGLIINWLVERISGTSFLSSLIIGLFSAIIYQLFFVIINQILYWLQIIAWPVAMNKTYFAQISFFIILNSLIILLTHRLCLTHLKLKTSL